MKNRVITVKGAPITIATRHEQDYISLTDMVRSFEGGSALIEQWLKAKDTVLFLGVWEQLNNADFNSLEFEGIRNEAGRNSFFLSARTPVPRHRCLSWDIGIWMTMCYRRYRDSSSLSDDGSRFRKVATSR
jgi:hypothetical protein